MKDQKYSVQQTNKVRKFNSKANNTSQSTKKKRQEKIGSKIKQDKLKASSPNITQYITQNIITINTNVLNLPVKRQEIIILTKIKFSHISFKETQQNNKDIVESKRIGKGLSGKYYRNTEKLRQPY